jgi:hypothetical protein
MNKKIRIVILLALGAVLPVSAQNWAHEPSSVFGLKLGEPVASSGIPACPRLRPGQGFPSELCIDASTPYADRVQMLNALPIKESYSGSIHLVDGMVSALHVETNHDSYARLRAVLIERYGQPTKRESASVTSMGGVVLPSETLEWIGRSNSLHLFERFDRIDRSMAAFTNNVLTEKSAEKANQAVKDAASKF